MTTTDIDLGINPLIKRMRVFGRRILEVGILDDPVAASYALINEFGAPKANIPERSFMRATIDANLDKYRKLVLIAVREVHNGRDPTAALNDVGEAIADDMATAALDFGEPDNDPSTIRQKGFNDPLLDTGRMINALGHKVIG